MILTIRMRGSGPGVARNFDCSNNPRDPGGMTNLGVTKRAWEAWVGHSVDEQDMRSLTPESVGPFYRAMYWNAAHGGSLPAPARGLSPNSVVTSDLVPMLECDGNTAEDTLAPSSVNDRGADFNGRTEPEHRIVARTLPITRGILTPPKATLSLCNNWRTQEDSNLWPLPSEGSALSS